MNAFPECQALIAEQTSLKYNELPFPHTIVKDLVFIYFSH